MSRQIKERLNFLSIGIAKFIERWLLNYNKFNLRTFYAETFSLCVLQQNGLLTSYLRKLLLSLYDEKNKDDSNFHWEFNNYALLNYISVSQSKGLLDKIYPLTFNNNKCTNWSLLRANVKLIADKADNVALEKARDRIKCYQLKSGLIKDSKKDNSFQYHCFSLAMVYEIYNISQDEFMLKVFLKGVDFIRTFILSTGQTNYIGRGQNQSFGYSALIYILSAYYNIVKDESILSDIFKVIRYIEDYQNSDGSFPLVFNGYKNIHPEDVNLNNEYFIGWYSYNNYFDYLSFFGFFLKKAESLLKNSHEKIIEKITSSYLDSNFIKVVRPKYEAIIAKPIGDWTNNISFPFIVYNGNNITSGYGGEQYEKSLYSAKGLPLPFCKLINKSIGWKSFVLMFKNKIIIFSVFGLFFRSFKFYEQNIHINSYIFSFLKFKHQYLFLNKICQQDDYILQDINYRIKSNTKLKFLEFHYSSQYKLKLFQCNGIKSEIKVLLK